jgi:hypothetical protein
MSWKFFVGACILSGGILFKAGAPVLAVALGFATAGFLNWTRVRSSMLDGRQRTLEKGQ